MGGGVSRLDGETWTTCTAADGLASNFVHAVVVAPDGTVWIGTNQGISRFTGLAATAPMGDGKAWSTYGVVDGETWTTYTTADGLVDNRVCAVAAAPDGALWFGTRQGVSRFTGPVGSAGDRGTWNSFPSLRSSRVRTSVR